LFTPVPADTYRVVVKVTGFYTDSLGDSVVTDGENQVMNVVLTPVGRGNLHVFVGVFAASPPYTPIPDAMVYAVLQGGVIQQDTLKAMTNGLGRVVFANALEGSYRIRAYAGGYDPDSAVKVLHVGLNDTGNVLLRVSAAATKTVSGMVRNKATGFPIEGAVVSLKLGFYVLIDTSVTAGDYTITFQASFTTGSLGSVAANYYDYDSTLGLSAAATTKNINMTAMPSTGAIAAVAAKSVVSRVTASFGRSTLSVSAPSSGVFSLYSLDGKLVFRTAVKAVLSVIKPRRTAGQSLIAELVCGKAVVREKVMVR
jgi:hypothetical protein